MIINDKHALLEANPEVCKRLFGVKYDTFEIILQKVQNHFDTHLIENPLSNRGIEGEFTIANQLLLTLEYWVKLKERTKIVAGLVEFLSLIIMRAI